MPLNRFPQASAKCICSSSSFTRHMAHIYINSKIQINIHLQTQNQSAFNFPPNSHPKKHHKLQLQTHFRRQTIPNRHGTANQLIEVPTELQTQTLHSPDLRSTIFCPRFHPKTLDLAQFQQKSTENPDLNRNQREKDRSGRKFANWRSDL